MIREDRELLAQLARLGREMAPLAMRMMDGNASQREQRDYARALIAAGERLRHRANETTDVIIEGEVLEEKGLEDGPLTPPEPTTQRTWSRG
ncbi:MAG TPA: hypothetical protein VFO16_21935 [Pseudonocardiaceae bacterium]|nr:hypothetical protein [Pseudonocardiaceae bacterium]